jgi:1,4-dihydroxy-2-naphthoate octaprenyltransferase
MSPRLRLPGLRKPAGPSSPEPAALEPELASPEPAALEPARVEPQAVASPEPAALEPAEPSTEATSPEPASPGPASPEPSAPEPETTQPPAPDEETEESGPVTVAEGVALLAAYRRAVLSWIAEDGYPMNVDVEIEVKPAESTVRFAEPPGFHIAAGTPVAITQSHVRQLPEGGFDERRYVTVWGHVSARPRSRYAVMPTRVWAWGEDDQPLAASYGRRLPQARRYFEAVSVGHAVAIRPRLSGRLALFRATHAPFLRATFVPLLLGLAVAVRAGVVDLVTAVITLALAGAVHLGLNVARGVFDLLHGPDEGGQGSTRSSAVAGVVGDTLAAIDRIPRFALVCYLAAGALGLALLVLRGSPEAAAIAVLGVLLVVAYGTPPVKLAGRGLGEVSAAIGFGPVLLLGTYAVQSRGAFSTEALLLSIPIGLLAGVIVYVGEIPNRVVDARAGRMTLPVRWSKAVVLRGFDVAAIAAFASLPVGVAAGFLPIPVLLALLAVPLAMRVRSDLVRHYDSPNALTAALAASLQLHMNVGLLLLGGYLLTIADQVFLMRAPFLR